MKYFILLATIFLISCSQSSKNDFTTGENESVVDVSMLNVDVNGEVLPIVLNMGEIAANKELSEKITIKNTKTSAIFLSMVMEQSPFKIKLNRCSSSLAAGKSCEITVAFNSRGLYDNTYSGELTLGSELPSIMLNAEVVGSPDPNTSGAPVLTMELDSPFFPKTSQSFRTLTVKNEGTGVAKNISLGVTANYDIRINRCPANLSPKSVCTIQVSQKNFRNTQPVDEPMTLSVPSLPPITLTTISLSSNGGGGNGPISGLVFFDSASSSPIPSSEDFENLEENIYSTPRAPEILINTGDIIKFKVTASEPFLFESFSFNESYPLKIRDKNDNLIFDGIGYLNTSLTTPLQIQTGDFLTFEILWGGNGFATGGHQGTKAVFSEATKNSDSIDWIPYFFIKKKVQSVSIYKNICDDSLGSKIIKMSKISPSYFETESYNHGDVVEYVKSDILFNSLRTEWINFTDAIYGNPAGFWQSPADAAKKTLLRQNPAIDAAVIAQEFGWVTQIGRDYRMAMQQEQMNRVGVEITPYPDATLMDMKAVGNTQMNGFSCVSGSIMLKARNPFVLKKLTIPAE